LKWEGGVKGEGRGRGGEVGLEETRGHYVDTVSLVIFFFLERKFG
jgi:hypothetical protein